jgi:hypothetical protein
MPAKADNYTVTSSSPDSIDFAITGSVQPGETIYLQGHTRQQLTLQNIQGTAANPITITNTGGQFVIDSGTSTTASTWLMLGCNHVILKGTPSPGNYDYGIKVAKTRSSQYGLFFGTSSSGVGSSDFEISDLEIAHTGYAGLGARCDSLTASSGFVMQNVKIHNLYIHDVAGEGMYIGSSFFISTDAHEIHGIEIYDNLVVNTAMDGIQLGCATQNASIHDNVISGYGIGTTDPAQDEGIRSNTGTAADIYNNLIVGSPGNSGTGIFADPYNSVKFYNNVIVTPQELGIYILETSQSKGYVSGYTVLLMNNTIISPGDYGIKFDNPSHSSSNRILNNIIAAAPSSHNVSILSTLLAQEAGNTYKATVAEVGFVDSANLNYRLTSSSPAVNTGVNVAAYGVATDTVGVARPQGSAYDAGAYEYVAPPAITTQPSSHTVNVGASVTFTVAASGTGPLTYQWQKNGVTLGGATSVSLALTNVQTTSAGNYAVVVSNPGGSTTSSAAVLTVNNPTGILVVAGYGQAGSGYCPSTGAFNEQPTWDGTNQVPTGISASPFTSTGTAYASRSWYVDFGTNYANVRITGAWTRYMPYTTASYSGFGTMWWDDDNDSTNDNGVTATGLNFCTAQSLNTGLGQPWVRDTNNSGAPITPQRRYLIINTGSAPSARANEFALSGYIVP